MDFGHYTGMALLDVQKAYDSVNHKILCKKLDGLGMNSEQVRSSYIDNMKQTADINGILSNGTQFCAGYHKDTCLTPCHV